MAHRPFVSYAQNREDVVLHRALAGIERGRYIDVGAQHPTIDSVSKAFYELGWRGITVDPVAAYAQRHREQRPGDLMVQVAITEVDGDVVVLHEVAETGLSTLQDEYGTQYRKDGRTVVDVEVATRRLDSILADAGWADGPIHFMNVDTEGTEPGVLRSLDLRRWRPWVLVIESTRPNSTTPAFQTWESDVLAAGYEFCLFDGVSRFYLADERRDDLGSALSYPACPRDSYITAPEAALEQIEAEADELESKLARLDDVLAESRGPLPARLATAEARLRSAQESVQRWRDRALQSWSAAVGGHPSAQVDPGELGFLRETTEHLEQELAALELTVSWRVSRPLRSVRQLVPLGRRR